MANIIHNLLSKFRDECKTITYSSLMLLLGLDRRTKKDRQEFAVALTQLTRWYAVAGGPFLTALVVEEDSKHPNRIKRPKRKFFSQLFEMGLWDGKDLNAFHDSLIQKLFQKEADNDQSSMVGCPQGK